MRITSPLARTAAGTSGQYVPGFVQANAMITWSYDDWGDYPVNTEHGGFCTWSYVYLLLAEIERRRQPPSEPCRDEQSATCKERNTEVPWGPLRGTPDCQEMTHCCTPFFLQPVRGWCRTEICRKCPGQENDPVNSICRPTERECRRTDVLWFCQDRRP